ncbi:AAC(3) family N-acetyltransferase [Magnetovibrio sp. PR-2]|uniref:AAC(3) family N-acetyltransferase n=1 Tax=Magnetovibrio sp. PR-2 TaxID=3120356 RepID=UPI002FCE028D
MTACCSLPSTPPTIPEFIDQLKTTFFADMEAVYWVSVDLRMVMRSLDVRHTAAEDFCDTFVRTLLHRLGDQATVIVPTFSMSFPDQKVFDVRETASMSGAFGGLLVKRYPQNRLAHPFYSFAAFGSRAPALLSTHFKHSTGAGSVFEWVMEHDVELVCIGHHFVKSLTGIHHAEEEAGVDYRYRKTFCGRVVGMDEETDVDCSFFVRELGTCDFSSMTQEGERHFRQSGLVQYGLAGTEKRPVMAQGLNLKVAHSELVADLTLETPKYVDFFGPERDRPNVITARVADRLYSEQLKALVAP